MKRTKRDIILDTIRDLHERLAAEIAFNDKPYEMAAIELVRRAEDMLHLAWPEDANKER